MKEDRLSGLALMHTHKQDVSLIFEDIVDDLQRLEAGGWSSSFECDQ